MQTAMKSRLREVSQEPSCSLIFHTWAIVRVPGRVVSESERLEGLPPGRSDTVRTAI